MQSLNFITLIMTVKNWLLPWTGWLFATKYVFQLSSQTYLVQTLVNFQGQGLLGVLLKKDHYLMQVLNNKITVDTFRGPGASLQKLSRNNLK